MFVWFIDVFLILLRVHREKDPDCTDTDILPSIVSSFMFLSLCFFTEPEEQLFNIVDRDSDSDSDCAVFDLCADNEKVNTSQLCVLAQRVVQRSNELFNLIFIVTVTANCSINSLFKSSKTQRGSG